MPWGFLGWSNTLGLCSVTGFCIGSGMTRSLKKESLETRPESTAVAQSREEGDLNFSRAVKMKEIDTFRNGFRGRVKLDLIKN